MTILFLHGSGSKPGGAKPSYFIEHGHQVLNPALPDEDFDEALRVAQATFDGGRPDLVIGSSRGGAVAMNLETGNVPLLLICPAWKRWGDARSVKAGSVVMHSRSDEIIPYAFSEQLVAASHPSARLVEAGTSHRMADAETLKVMLRLALELIKK